VTSVEAGGDVPVVGASVLFLPGGEELSSVMLSGGVVVSRRRFCEVGRRVPGVTDGKSSRSTVRVLASWDACASSPTVATEVRAAPSGRNVALRRGRR
jgi:hypothetical protein